VARGARVARGQVGREELAAKGVVGEDVRVRERAARGEELAERGVEPAGVADAGRVGRGRGRNAPLERRARALLRAQRLEVRLVAREVVEVAREVAAWRGWWGGWVGGGRVVGVEWRG
jgi:hypothetical protein